LDFERIVPGSGEVALLWFNPYAGVAIKTPTKTLVVDPVNVNAKAFPTVDALLITHEHYDHLDQSLVRELHKRTNCLVIADATSARRLENMVADEKLLEAKPGLETKIGEVIVKAEKCHHPPASTPITFIIKTEDGITIFHTADSLPFPEMQEIGEREKLDIVFCTVGIAPGASPRTGVEIAKLVKPKVAVPYHTNSTADLNRFAQILAEEMPNVKCMFIERGKPHKYP
jgi:L-ascorbate metabolism protein UlaG (beta-lactamase superfamily)